jgi:hypothetical protein
MSSVAPEGEVQIKARKKHESTLELPPGSAIHWEFRLHSKDIGFSAQFERETESGQLEQEQVCQLHTSLIVGANPSSQQEQDVCTNHWWDTATFLC